MPESTRLNAEPEHVVNATRARQGRITRHMIWVLMVSTLLAGIGLLLVWTWKAPQLAAAKSDNGHASVGPAFNAPDPAEVTRQADTPPAPPQPKAP